ncbi:MAG: hypothetical protein LUH15_16760 [Tannerellaceae bacterium]|nr:hypothetical protein [Tannerellaceae bacterium]
MLFIKPFTSTVISFLNREASMPALNSFCLAKNRSGLAPRRESVLWVSVVQSCQLYQAPSV